MPSFLSNRSDSDAPSRKRDAERAILALNLASNRLDLLLTRHIGLSLPGADQSQLTLGLALNLQRNLLLGRAIVRHLNKYLLPITLAAGNPVHRPESGVSLHAVDLLAAVDGEHLLHEVADGARDAAARVVAEQVGHPVLEAEVLQHGREGRGAHHVAVALHADHVHGLADGADHGRVLGRAAVVVRRAAVLAHDHRLRARLVVEGAEVAHELVWRQVLVHVLEDAFRQVLDYAGGAVLLCRRRDEFELGVNGADGVVELLEARWVGVAAVVEEVFVADFDEGDVEGVLVAQRNTVLAAGCALVAEEELFDVSWRVSCVGWESDLPQAHP